MMEIIKPDLCIIGAGAGGLDAAAGAALAGKSIVLVEREGGSRLKAVVPSKALVTAARLARQIAGADAFGLTASQPDINVDKLRRYVERVTAALAPDSAPERFAGLGVRVVTGPSRFFNQRRLAVGEEIEIRARHYVIATGSRPTVPDVHGLAEVPYLTEESVLALARLPTHLVVIGASVVALELAQAFRRLGAAVVVIDQGEPLAQEDPECTRVVLDALVREGVDLRTNVAIDAVAKTADGVRVTLSAGLGSVDGSHLLVACGRRANVEGLALDNAGVKVGPAGIVVDRALRTSNRHIYAIGDVTGAPPFIHVARHHAGLVVHVAVLGLPARLRPEALPRVLFTDPEFAHVGLTEAEAETRRIPVRVLRWPYHENDRAQIEQATRGHLKILTNRAGRVLGATIVGAAASEVIAPWSLAVGWGLDIRVLAGILLPYPTLGDTGHRAAMTYLTLAYRRTWVQRNLGLVTGPVSGLVSRVISGLLGR
jgi:pyruvate/2-oxoglutarate dehydrogenase complex dihydrolipoamide dehydrogenase (E3) component